MRWADLLWRRESGCRRREGITAGAIRCAIAPYTYYLAGTFLTGHAQWLDADLAQLLRHGVAFFELAVRAEENAMAFALALDSDLLDVGLQSLQRQLRL